MLYVLVISLVYIKYPVIIISRVNIRFTLPVGNISISKKNFNEMKKSYQFNNYILNIIETWSVLIIIICIRSLLNFFIFFIYVYFD